MSWALAIIILVLIAWDVLLSMSDAPNTWSEQARLAAPRLPVLPWFVGALVGHLFPIGRLFSDSDAASGAMVGLTGVVLLWSVLIQLGLELPLPLPGVWQTALAGLLAAYLLWPAEERVP